MAGSIYAWSTTAASNDTADGDINWQENQLPDTVNNSARQMMGRLAEFRNDVSGWLASGGTANSLTLTANSAFTSLAPGRVVAFRAAASNTGAASINVNALGSKAIRKMDSTGDVALVANDIRINGIYTLQYSTALDGGSGAWLLLNPTLSAAIYALSSLALTDNAVVRANGTNGLQNSGVIIDDSNNVSGIASLSATSGTFSSTLSATNITSSTGIFASSVGSTMAIRPNGAGSIVGQFDIATNGNASAAAAVSSGTGIFAHTSGGTMGFRPNGPASLVGQMDIATSGAVTINGTLSLNTGGFGIIQSTSSDIALRPAGNAANQMTVDTSGNATINGTLTVTG